MPLWCKTHFSFLEGASTPDELFATARKLGLDTLAVTDRDGVPGIPRAHVAAKEHGVKLIVGSELSIDDDSRLVVLVQDRQGYANLCRLVTKGRLRSAKGECRIGWSEVAEHATGLIALWGGAGSLLGQATASTLAATASLLREAFADRLYALVARHQHAGEMPLEERLRRWARRLDLPVVAAVEVLYHDRSRRRLQDVLSCIREGVVLADAGRLLRPNDHHFLKSGADFARLFQDDPEAVARSRAVAERCTFNLDQLRYRYPLERLPSGLSPSQWLEELTLRGARERFGLEVPERLLARIRQELELIRELDYDGYFLTMWEIVQFCRREHILCQGRGSAANSVVCYCLGVTAVNPQEVDLLFERFISRERAEPPDIDLDIEHERREEVIQHVYQKYGRERAAMVANIVRYRTRSAIREVGKVLGLPQVGLDRLAKLTSYHGGLDEEALRDAGLDPAAPVHAHLIQLVAEIQDFPRHLSIHPGGFLLGHEPVHDLVPIENGSMPDRTVIQWDKEDVETVGLFKVDLLGLGALRQLHLAFDLLREHRGMPLSLAEIPRSDSETFDMLCRADSVGVFQVESRAQMNMLPRLLPRTYYDLVIEISIVRPGPITGGMVHPYISRRHGREPITYPHPALEPVLRKTLGVPLFQEQVMRLAMVAADYTPGEADQLRRDMATWRRHGPMERHHDRLVSRMVTKGITKEFAERVFDQIRGFGEYGFPESHAASFALIAYATAWLKCHHHEVFSCALLNAQPMGFYSPATIVEDAKRHDITVRPIDVCHSRWDCTLEEDSPGTVAGPRAERWRRRPLAIRMGLRYVKGLGSAEREAIARARTEGSARPFTSVIDFARRTRLDSDKLVSLAEAGAFASLQPDRRQALWEIHGLPPSTEPRLALPEQESQPTLFPLSDFEVINWDWRSSSHSTHGHPLGPVREELTAQGLPDAHSLNQLPHGTRARYAGIVICRQRPGTANDVTFMTLEDETGFVNLVLWSNVFERYKVLAKTLSFMGITGKIQAEEGVVHLIVDSIWQPELPRQPVLARSRDFH